MKKGTKICVILSVILLLSGIAMIVGGVIVGINPDTLVRNININTEDIDGKVMEETFTVSDNKDFIIRAAGADVEIKNAKDGEFGIDDSENIKVWDCKDNEIRLVTKKRKTGVSKHNKIVVYIPENYKFNKVDIKCGAGNLWIGGKINADKMDIECGAGNVEMSDIKVKDASIECGAGNTYLKGDISGNIKAESGIGNVELHVNRDEEYYNYSVECALGNIDINDNEYGGFATERKINNDSDYTMDIECAMGNVTIQTIN